jgi:molybdopterin-guanine dinucleotide biosynthesis protein MobB
VLKLKVVAVVGSKKSGKTTTTEVLIKELTGRGYRIAAVKHVSERNFTIDQAGKDTWRFAKAGARTIISVAAGEIATIEKVRLEDLPLETILKKCGDNDLVFIEGLKGLVGKNKDVQKIVVVKASDEAVRAMKSFNPILAFSGPFSTEPLGLGVLYADALRNPKKLADIVEETLTRS